MFCVSHIIAILPVIYVYFCRCSKQIMIYGDWYFTVYIDNQWFKWMWLFIIIYLRYIKFSAGRPLIHITDIYENYVCRCCDIDMLRQSPDPRQILRKRWYNCIPYLIMFCTNISYSNKQYTPHHILGISMRHVNYLSQRFKLGSDKLRIHGKLRENIKTNRFILGLCWHG